MAKKRHHTKKHRTHRRRRMGAAGGSHITEALLIAAGAVAGNYVVKLLPTTMNAKVAAAIPLAAGIALPMISKNKMLADIGTGMFVTGVLKELTAMNVLQGIAGYNSPMIAAPMQLPIQTKTPIVAGTKYTY